MQNLEHQHLDSIGIHPDVTLLLEYSEPDQGGTRLSHRFRIFQNKEVEVDIGYLDAGYYIENADPDKAGRLFDLDNDGKTDFIFGSEEHSFPTANPPSSTNGAYYTDGSNWWNISLSSHRGL